MNQTQKREGIQIEQFPKKTEPFNPDVFESILDFYWHHYLLGFVDPIVQSNFEKNKKRLTEASKFTLDIIQKEFQISDMKFGTALSVACIILFFNLQPKWPESLQELTQYPYSSFSRYLQPIVNYLQLIRDLRKGQIKGAA